VIDGSQPIGAVFGALQQGVNEVIQGMTPGPTVSPDGGA